LQVKVSHRDDRFLCSVQSPGVTSRRLYAGRHQASHQAPAWFVPRSGEDPGFDDRWKKLSTPRQRFACARLVIPYLTHSLRLFFNAAGSAGGISPPAAHRTVHKRLRLHGSSQPFPCDLAVAKRRGRSRLIPVTRLATISSELNHPLCSMPITGTSTLIRDDPPPAYASVLSPFVGPTYKVFP
jgi:hypothetical protein